MAIPTLRSKATARHAGIACVVLAAAIAGSALLAMHWRRQAAAQRDVQHHLLAELAAAASRPADAAGTADFTATLPAAVDPSAVFGILRRAAADRSVAIGALGATPQAANAQHLGRLDVSITVRGNYAALKDVLADVLGRFPNAVVQHARWRRLGAPGDVEAAWDLSLLERPAVAAQALPGRVSP